MAARYQHIVADVRREVATSVGRLLWKPVQQSAESVPDLTDSQLAAIQLLLATLPEPWCERPADLFGDKDETVHLQ